MKLYELLPNELLQKIAVFLPRQSIAVLCQTSKIGYKLFLPTLYRHIELGHRAQMKQLEEGLLHNQFLRETLRRYTYRLTLKCRQGGGHHYCWLFIISILCAKELIPNVRQLCFRDFLTLSVHKVNRIVRSLPYLTHVDFQYCNLITIATEKMETGTHPLIKELNLLWTDFTIDAIQELLQHMPHLSCVVLGANHNRTPLANDAALDALTRHCPDIEALSISLQQVKEGSLCQAIELYGPRLRHLSIRCEGYDTLWAISNYTRQLQDLIIRWCCDSNKGDDQNKMIKVLEMCKDLNRLEIISCWPLHDYFLPHLTNGWQVDQAILSEEDRVVVIRFGHDWDPICMQMDEILYSIAEKVKNFAVIYLVDITEVPDFNKMYELYDPCTTMFFFRNKHIMVDLGTGNNNKINWALDDKQEMIDLIEIVYRGARKGRGLVVSLKDYSTKYKY
ncbi:mitosis protein DIM1-domain-containing protein [Cokeromyces recurvatus]|uniref:mitosis protein DIM1-domain-containing protein n=1 Tax=Cokeromyces recurvatus TaxID=90255 RepID=UPI002220C82C|nr:mitosis protein DIM1-domain-containing protein [Cokeromyces recurvatus]KAI7898281.1 mitosis protein DIM1-domain-containing protein [Cokeromyces recurvatus]